MFRDDEHLYWFVGAALVDEFAAVQADYEHMAHTVIRRADDVRAEELTAPAEMDFISLEGTGYSIDYPVAWVTDTAENFETAWVVMSPEDISLTGDPAKLEIIIENEDVLQTMPHNPVAGMVRLTSAIPFDEVYLVSLLED